jgi:SWIM zinc finger
MRARRLWNGGPTLRRVRRAMAAAEQTYRYLAPSTVETDGDRSEVTLATSGGREANPYFFSGFLGHPQQTAAALLVVGEVARTRYYEPPQMVRARILAADPVVTSNVDRLRFESFSACAGVYARLDLEPGVLDGRPATWGTTNVDFNPPMRAALARVREADAMLMHVGHDEVRVTTLSGSAVERKVPLPERWLKGFAEVQVASAHLILRHELTAVEARRFLQSLPRTRSRSVAWATPAGRGLRLASRPDEAAVCLAGPERLRLLEKLLPFAKALRVYGPVPTLGRAAEPGVWELQLEGARVFFALSPELFRGFSGEGGVLSDLSAADEEAVDAVAETLHGEPEIDTEEVARDAGLERTAVQTALGALGAAGRVGYDLAHSAYFHRELPYDRAVLEKMHPRLLAARELYEQGAVRLTADGEATVRSGEAEYLVRTGPDGLARCTCAWFARHLGQRGPCKHVLAVEHARRTVGVT